MTTWSSESDDALVCSSKHDAATVCFGMPCSSRSQPLQMPTDLMYVDKKDIRRMGMSGQVLMFTLGGCDGQA